MLTKYSLALVVKMIQRKLALWVVTLCILKCVKGHSRIDPLVDTKMGLIRGLRASDGEYSMFMGIPYATVDKENPFGPSVPYSNFDDVFEAYDDSAICPQIEEFNNTIVGTLDCLHLNIYVPNTATSRNRLPVLVWIYGGGFTIGFSGRYLYGPQYFVRHNIILVTINYRLGPFGFMCLDTPNVPGNQGLKDQLLAMKWIKNNIESFGGDQNKITLFGESAGGVSVDLHLYFNDEKLFDKIITQSGSVKIPSIVRESDKAAPLKLASQLGFITDNTDEALSFLSTIDPRLVIAASQEIDSWYRPCIEQEFEGVERFIRDFPVNMQPNIRNMPVLTGFNEFERLSNYANKGPEYYENLDLFKDFMSLAFNFDDQEVEEKADIVRHFYIGDNAINQNVMWDLIAFDSDSYFIHPTLRNIQTYLTNGAKDVYFYMFAYDGKRNFVKHRLNISEPGATHADEMGYLFDISYMQDTPSTEDQYVIDAMTKMWANFVIYGNPTPQLSDLLPVVWSPVTKNIMYYMEINSELKLKTRPMKSRMAFWDLFYKENENFEKGYREPTK